MRTKLKRRDKLSDQIIVSLAPSMKRELFEAAAARNMTASDFTRTAILACISRTTKSPAGNLGA